MVNEIGVALTALGGALLYFGIRGYRKTSTSATAPTAAPKLGIELVPLAMQGYNVRSRISPEQWQQTASITHKRANRPRTTYRCEICHQSGKDQGFKHPVECHEVWDYDDETHIQKLTGLVSLCPLCHKAKHYGLAKKQGYESRVRAHMKQVNNWSESELNASIAQAFHQVKARSDEYWILDLTYLNTPHLKLNATFTNDEQANCDKPIFF
ncbi:MAG: HNH endonuclease [Nitrospiraceae bacterium]